jgi:putative salt-induced outer membrane protein YdiY
MQPKRLFGLAGLLALGVAPVATADQIRLKNGDVLTGEIIKKEAATVFFKTSYAGELKVLWTEVESIVSDNPVRIMLTDGSLWQGELEAADPGAATIRLEQIEAAKAFPLQETRYINPNADILNQGIKWSGHISAGATLSQGNNETKGLHLDAESVARTRNNRFTVTGEFNRVEDRDRTTQFNSRLRGKYDHFFSRKWYGYLNTAFDNDRFQDLRLRSLFGGGSGYQIFEGPNLNLSLEGGLNLVREDYYHEEEDKSYPGVRWAVKYSQLLFASSTRLFHEHEVLVDIEKTHHVLLSSKTGLRFPPIFNFNATTQLNLDWDNQPPPGLEKTDSTLLFTLGYGW